MVTLSERLHLIENLANAYGAVSGTGRLAFTVDILTDLIHWSANDDGLFEGALALARSNAASEAIEDVPPPSILSIAQEARLRDWIRKASKV